VIELIITYWVMGGFNGRIGDFGNGTAGGVRFCGPEEERSDRCGVFKIFGRKLTKL
jgi:hypothetical protein